jgi:hypothetical protein
MNTQSGTQWDGFRHFAHMPTGSFYNGVSISADKPPAANGANRPKAPTSLVPQRTTSVLFTTGPSMASQDAAYFLTTAATPTRKASTTTRTTTTQFHGKSCTNAAKIKALTSDQQLKVATSRSETCCSSEVAGKRHTTTKLMQIVRKLRSDMELGRMAKMVSDMRGSAKKKRS